MSAKHPERKILAAFGSGKLEPAEAMAVEAHIAECEECCETLHGLGSDTFVDLVRESRSVQLDPADDGTLALSEIQNEAVSELPDELTKHPRYRVIKLLGKGGMGNVFMAEHTLMNRAVALKVINPDLIQNVQAVERFRREVQSAAQLAHSNIVTAHDAEQAGDMHLLVMEYVPGDNLSDVVKRDGPLDISLASDYIRQAAQGLQHAHEKGMVHRDVKPHNLMVTSDGQVKILDFGLATLAEELTSSDDNSQNSQAGVSRTSPNLTSAGSMMGTPDFMSPEQSRDARAADIRSDIYSLGCTFYYLLTGQPPFSEGSALERIKAHSEQEAEAIENVRDEVPPDLAEILRRMMTKDPAQRFQTPAEIADALAPFVDAHRTIPPQDAVPDSTKAADRSWWPPSIVQSVALAAIALVLAGIIYITTDNGTLEIDASDDSVEIVIRSAGNPKKGQQPISEMRIVDTLTGTSVKRLPSGEYVLSLKGDKNDFELDKDRFVLRRGDTVIVRVTPRPQLAAKRAPAGQALRTIWANAIDVSGKVSPDGQYVAFVDWETRDLAIRNLVDGTNLRLTDRKNEGGRGYANTPMFSPNSKQIAFAWTNGELRVIDIDGKNQRTIYRNKETPAIFPYDWSPDASEILAHVGEWDNTRRIVRVSVEDGNSTPVTTLGWNYLESMMFSPDGDYIAYAATPTQHARHTDIYVVATDGGDATPVVQDPSNDVLLGWAPDGQRILFSSDRAGRNDAWVIGFRDGKPEGRPQLAKSNIGDVWPMGVTSDGAFYFGANHGAKDIFTADFDSKTGKVSGPLENISTKTVGANLFPGWSPSGDRIAFASERDQGGGQHRSISVVSLESGQEKTLSTQFGYFFGAPSWSSDERLLRVWGVEFANRKIEALYSVDVENEASERLTEQWVQGWSRDGETAYSIGGRKDGYIEVRKVDLATDTRTVFDRVRMETQRRFFQIFQMAVSPDGRKVAYTKYLEEMGAWHIVLRDADGRDEVDLYKIRHGQGVQQLNWTHDGESLLFGEGVSDFVLIPIDGGSPTPIQLNIEDEVHAVALHPRGNRIAINIWQKPKRDVWVLENFLPRLAPAIEPQGPKEQVVRQAWRDAPDVSGAVSPDGREVSFTDWDTGDLAIRNLASKTNRRVTNKGSWDESDEYVESSKFSPDGKQLVYSWINKEGSYELRIISREGSDPKLVYASDNIIYAEPRDWSPNGERVLALLSRKDGTNQIALISVEDKTATPLKTLDWRYPGPMEFSPDGKYIAYDLPQDDEGLQNDILVIAADGSGETPLIEHPADDKVLGWSPDGHWILFASNRTGTRDAWLVEVADGKRKGTPILAKPNMGEVVPMGFTSEGSYYFGVAKAVSEVHTASLDPLTTKIGPLENVAQRAIGKKFAPSWSADGDLAYLLAGKPRTKIIILSASGQERELSPRLNYIIPRPPVWSPDRSSLLVTGEDLRNQFGLFSVDVSSGSVRQIVRGLAKGQWSPDGNAVYVYHGDDGRIFKRALHSGKERTIVQLGKDMPASIAISPGGDSIAFTMIDDQKQSWVLKVIPTAGGNAADVYVAAKGKYLLVPHWTSDGKSLIFGEYIEGESSFSMISAEGGVPRRLQLGVKGVEYLNIHPDGKQIALSIKQEGTREVSVLENFLPPLVKAN